MSEPLPEEEQEKMLALIDQIGKLLEGKGPAVQGAVLGGLLTMWICGWQGRAKRKDAMETHFKHVRGAVDALCATEDKRRLNS